MKHASTRSKGNSELVYNLIRDGYLRSDPVIKAFHEIGRAEFVPVEFEEQAEMDVPLPIGFGQIIPQPATVAVMLELLDLHPGQSVLEVGSGSGWTTALLASAVGSTGRVVAIERVHELFERGKENVAKYAHMDLASIEFVLGNGSDGYAKFAPYDRMLLSVAVEDLPDPLKEELAIGGKMVVPIYNSITYFEKRPKDNAAGGFEWYKEVFPGFSFVPLISRS